MKQYLINFILIMALIVFGVAMLGCKKDPMQKPIVGCIQPLPIGTKVTFSEPQRQSAGGFNQHHMYILPFKIDRVLGQKCDFVFYQLIDEVGDTARVYSMNLKLVK